MSEFKGKTARENGVQGCPTCTLVGSVHNTHCNACDSPLHGHAEYSLQKTWAWLLTSVLLYVPANALPIMHTTLLGRTTDNTILGGIVVLWEHGSYPIAAVIFIASVLVPLGKIVVLGWLCITVQTGSVDGNREKTILYRVTELVGRWSMVDVFVVGILVALIQLGNIMYILPGPAALAFAAMVVTTMIAAIEFDPRLIWSLENREEKA